MQRAEEGSSVASALTGGTATGKPDVSIRHAGNSLIPHPGGGEAIDSRFRGNDIARRGALLVLLIALLLRLPALAQSTEPDWPAVTEGAAGILSEYVQIDTQNPPGRTVEAANFLEKLARRAGLDVSRAGDQHEKPILLARLRGKGNKAKPIVLLNHMDVVPADPQEWSFPPLSGRVHDGLVYGRGTLDMKGFGVAQLVALQLLVERGERPEHDLLFLAVPDEETGGGMGVEWLSQKRPDLMDVEAVWDEGGLGLTDAFSVPALLVSVVEKQVLWIRLVAEGPAGHGSRPFPEAAPLRLQKALERIFANLPPPRLTPTVVQTFTRVGGKTSGLTGMALRNIDNPFIWPIVRRTLVNDPLREASVRDTISLTMLNAGYKPNVIPERAEAVLDCRLLPGTHQDVFLSNLKRTLADDTIRIEIIQPAQPAKASPTKHALFKAIESAARDVYPNTLVTPYMAIGGTDSRFFRVRGVPAYGLIPILLSKDLVASIHGIDERIPVEALGKAVQVVYHALRRL